MRKILFLIICSVFLISGCGSSGDGAAFFETVEVTAHCEITSLNSDIILWKGDPNELCYSKEILSDEVDITIKSFPFNEEEISSQVNEEEIPSHIKIENVRIDYEPVPNTPPLASEFQKFGMTIKSKGEISLKIPVMQIKQKEGFLEDPDHYAALIDNMAYYKYYVTLTFGVVEIDTDKKGEVKTGLTIELHDFICPVTGGSNCDDDCYRNPDEFRP